MGWRVDNDSTASRIAAQALYESHSSLFTTGFESGASATNPFAGSPFGNTPYDTGFGSGYGFDTGARSFGYGYESNSDSREDNPFLVSGFDGTDGGTRQSGERVDGTGVEDEDESDEDLPDLPSLIRPRPRSGAHCTAPDVTSSLSAPIDDLTPPDNNPDVDVSQEGSDEKERESWTIGSLMRTIGVDPTLFDWDDEESEFSVVTD